MGCVKAGQPCPAARHPGHLRSARRRERPSWAAQGPDVSERLLQITHSMSSYDESGNPSAGLEGVGLAELERRARSRNGGLALPLKDWIALTEAWRIAQALRETRGNRSAAARALGIGRRTLYSKMEKLGLEPSWGVDSRRVDFVRRPLEIREERRG